MGTLWAPARTLWTVIFHLTASIDRGASIAQLRRIGVPAITTTFAL